MRRLLALSLVFVAACGPGVDEPEGVPVAQLRSGLTMSAAGGCSTNIASALDAQLIEELNCVQKNLMVNFSGSHVTLYSGVVPWLAPDAAADLKAATVVRNDSMTISSAYRTLGSQYLLYKWWRQGQCGIQLAAVPGSSNHQSGRAIDTPYYSVWRTALSSKGWTWLGSSDTVHFDHFASPNISSKSVLAFQRLWNKNHSTGRLTEDGVWGPNTEAAMGNTPTTGFATHGCPTTGKLSGTITAASGGALSGVTVTAGGRSVTTGTNGAFEFTLGAGSYTVAASKSGYVSKSVSRAVVLGGTVSASMALAPVATTGRLRGVVVDAADASVKVSGAVVTVGGQMISTDAAGAFTATLPGGAASWTVSAVGFTSKTGSSTITVGADTSVTVALTRASVDTPPRVEVLSPDPGGTFELSRVVISGTAVDDQAALSEVQVVINGGAPVTVPVVSGAFEAEVQLAAGANTLTVSARDSGGLTASASWSGTFLAGFDGLVHRFDDNALIIANAQLELFELDTGVSLGATTSDLEGRFTLVSSATGLHRLHVEAEGYTPRDVVVDVSIEERTQVDVGLTPGAVASIRFIEPEADAVIDAEEVTVSGVVTGLEVSAVTVNGEPAQLLGAGFVVKVPLVEGTNEFEAIAESPEGFTVRASVRVLRPMTEAKGGCAAAGGSLWLLGLVALLTRRRS